MIQKFVNKWCEKISVLIHIHIFMKYHIKLEKEQKEEEKLLAKYKKEMTRESERIKKGGKPREKENDYNGSNATEEKILRQIERKAYEDRVARETLTAEEYQIAKEEEALAAFEKELEQLAKKAVSTEEWMANLKVL